MSTRHSIALHRGSPSGFIGDREAGSEDRVLDEPGIDGSPIHRLASTPVSRHVTSEINSSTRVQDTQDNRPTERAEAKSY